MEKQEKQADIELSEKQKEALLQVNNSNISIITGVVPWGHFRQQKV